MHPHIWCTQDEALTQVYGLKRLHQHWKSVRTWCGLEELNSKHYVHVRLISMCSSALLLQDALPSTWPHLISTTKRTLYHQRQVNFRCCFDYQGDVSTCSCVRATSRPVQTLSRCHCRLHFKCIHQWSLHAVWCSWWGILRLSVSGSPMDIRWHKPPTALFRLLWKMLTFLMLYRGKMVWQKRLDLNIWLIDYY